MSNTPPTRPWWRKKRWLAAALSWLLLWYPLSAGPYVYFKERGWLKGPKVGYLWDPIPLVFGVSMISPYRHDEAPLLFRCWHDYGSYCRETGIRHREAERQAERQSDAE